MKITACLLALLNQSRENVSELVSTFSAYESCLVNLKKTCGSYVNVSWIEQLTVNINLCVQVVYLTTNIMNFFSHAYYPCFNSDYHPPLNAFHPLKRFLRQAQAAKGGAEGRLGWEGSKRDWPWLSSSPIRSMSSQGFHRGWCDQSHHRCFPNVGCLEGARNWGENKWLVIFRQQNFWYLNDFAFLKLWSRTKEYWNRKVSFIYILGCVRA